MNWSPRARAANRRRLSLALLLPSLLLSGCGGLPLDTDAAATPRFDPSTSFPGDIAARDLVQDWRGRVMRSFEVGIDGTIRDDVVFLQKCFRSNDDETSTRTWRITRNSDGSLSGAADDVVGIATGAHAGDRMHWRYTMNLAVGGFRYRVAFDDWRWRLGDRAWINRSDIRKFGRTAAEVTLFMDRAG